MARHPLLITNPEGEHFPPLFYGTNVSVTDLVHVLTGGGTVDDFLAQFPQVTRQQALGFLNSTQNRVYSFYSVTQLTSKLTARVNEMKAIHAAGVSITGSLDHDAMHQAVHRAIAGLMDCDSFVISSYDGAEGYVRAEYVYHEGQVVDTSLLPPLPFDDTAPPQAVGTQGYAIRTGKSLRIGDFRQHTAGRRDGYYYDDGEVTRIEDTPEDGTDETRALLIVPVKLEGRVTGVIQVMSFRPHAYTDEHLRFAEAIAPYAAIAAQNARLYRQRQFQNAHLEILYSITRHTLDARPMTEITAAALHRLGALLGARSYALWRYAGAGAQGTLLAMTDPPAQWPQARARLADTGEDLIEDLFMDSETADPGDPEADPVETLRCAAALRVGADLAGVLIMTMPRGTPLVPAERDALREVAAHLAASCHTLDLAEQARAHRAELEARVAQRTADLNRALESERSLNQLKMRLMAMISHELRNPLAVIMTSAELLDRHDARMDYEKRQTYLARILGQAQHMRGIMEDTLTFGRLESAAPQPRRVPVDLLALAEQQSALALHPHAGRTVTVTSSGAPRLIALDRDLMAHVLSNILTNALKYSSPETPVTLHVAFAPDAVTVRIADEGIGIPPADLAQVGEPFFRAQNVGDVQGTGLGLALVRRILVILGGTMEIVSAPGEGTTVILTLT